MADEKEVAASVEAENAAFLAEMAEPIANDDVKAPVIEEEKPAEVEPSEPVIERKEVLPGYTAEELKAKLEKLDQIDRLQKAIDTTAGTFGSRLADQQKMLEQLKEQKQSGLRGTPKLERMSREYPEIAEMLASDLIDSIGSGQAVDNSALEKSFAEQIAAMKEQAKQEAKQEVIGELGRRELAKQHQDWREIALFDQLSDDRVQWRNPQFGNWVNSQPVEVQRELIFGTDASYLAQKLTEFKKAIKPAVVKKNVVDAVFPQGSKGRTVSNDLSEEEAAFRAEMARR